MTALRRTWKAIAGWLCVAVLLCGCVGTPRAFAADGALGRSDFSLSCRTAGVTAGNQVSVWVDVTENSGVAAFAVAVSYDRSALTLRSAQVQESLLGGEYVASQTVGDYPYVVVFDGSLLQTPSHATGHFLKLTFDVAEGIAAGDYPVELRFTEGGAPLDVNLNALSGSPAGGTICVLPEGALQGDVNASGWVNIVDAQCTYDLGKGIYGDAFERFPLPEGWTYATLFCIANVNGDDAVDAADAFAIQRFVHYGGWA